MEKKISYTKLFIIFLLGVSMLMYPWISEYIYENRADAVINAYTEKVQKEDKRDTEKIIEKAQKYNSELMDSRVKLTDPFVASDEEKQIEEDILGLNEDGLIGIIQIPKISVNLPVYQGTDSDTLLAGIGHMEKTSLPVGGAGTHCVLTGHTGLTGSKMFTDLILLEKGDIFFLKVLNQILTYQVVEINTVLPKDTSKLFIQKDRDLCTLLTCTPYGVNSHRLLVTGERIEYSDQIEEAAKKEEPVKQTEWMKDYFESLQIGILIFLIILAVNFIIEYLHRIYIYKKRH